jgi:arylsulfatase A-like enzyme
VEWKNKSSVGNNCHSFQWRGPPTARAQEKKPNVVFILADNVGYGDLGSYGGGELRGAPTPRIDQLAREGLRLTQFLVEPGCTPSRAALMTGQYSIRNGLSLIIVPGSESTLSKRAVTMGELFKEFWNTGFSASCTAPTSTKNGFFIVPVMKPNFSRHPRAARSRIMARVT